MKRISIVVLMLVVLMLCSCNNSNTTYDSNKIKVSIIDSEFYDASIKNELVGLNSNFKTVLTMRDGYVIDSCNYDDYDVKKLEDNKYELTFRNIEHPLGIKINCYRKDGFNTYNEEFEASIIYNYNDGSDEYKLINYKLSYHIRANTWTATDLKRDGYVLNGWNTKSDLTGERIGLGSRVSVNKDETLELYAHWVKCTDVSLFSYKLNVDEVTLTGYKGAGTEAYICLPEYIDGHEVVAVSNAFTTNIPCDKIKSKTLIIPNTITYIENYAFENSEFENIYFSDNLSFQSYKCFNYNIKHYFLNAYLEPRLQAKNYNVRFADNIDLLIKYQNEKKIILYGGCNFAYGIYSPMIEKAFPDYKVINCGINGEFNSLFQMEIIEKYVNENDVFIHCPEQMNEYQFMNRLLVDSRVFAMVEGNYDLLGIANFGYTPFIIEAYTDYNRLREKNDVCSYDDEAGMFNTYGDYLEDRDYFEATEQNRDVSYTEGWRYNPSILKEDNIGLLGRKYNDIAAKGATVFFTEAPMNENSADEEVIFEKAKEFENMLKEVLKGYNVTIISNATDYIFKGRYFFDTDYHLNYFGAELRTEKLIEDLKRAGVK